MRSYTRKKPSAVCVADPARLNHTTVEYCNCTRDDYYWYASPSIFGIETLCTYIVFILYNQVELRSIIILKFK